MRGSRRCGERWVAHEPHQLLGSQGLVKAAGSCHGCGWELLVLRQTSCSGSACGAVRPTAAIPLLGLLSLRLVVHTVVSFVDAETSEYRCQQKNKETCLMCLLYESGEKEKCLRGWYDSRRSLAKPAVSSLCSSC